MERNNGFNEGSAKMRVNALETINNTSSLWYTCKRRQRIVGISWKEWHMFKKHLAIITKICPQCRKRFKFRNNKIYCSSFCRFKFWALEHPRIKINQEALNG